METTTVEKTVSLDLCVCCETCAAACPAEAIGMEYTRGLFVPKIDDSKCTDCGLCLRLCPGMDIDPGNMRSRPFGSEHLYGPVLDSYIGHSNERGVVRNSTSGGLVTTLIVELLKSGEFDLAFVLEFDTFGGAPARLKGTNEVPQVLKAAKSKYIPASAFEVIKAVRRRPDGRFIAVGTPCQFNGIKKSLEENGTSPDQILFLGLFCDRTLNFNLLDYFEKGYGRKFERLTKFEFRTKERRGWPGDVKLSFDSGREMILKAKQRMRLKPFFQLNRCLFCLDKLNVSADISFGDCYIENRTSVHGKSSIIVRTEKGKAVFDRYSHLFTLERIDVREIGKSQGLANLSSRLDNIRVFVRGKGIFKQTEPANSVSKTAEKKLLRSQRRIKRGRDNDVVRIRLAVLVSVFLGFLKLPLRALKRMAAGRRAE
ncbi:MAG: Coenzyme F420 hydrogenase/dehydrogenase, beta subunit C-terminal domain [Planctomycetota bacterium]|jgi:coenzyme F420 hydrogenase subunit beta